jgi:hypothetical protein
MKFNCCVCKLEVEIGQSDTYTIQISKPSGIGFQKRPELMWAHGPCLREAIPLVAIEIPN